MDLTCYGAGVKLASLTRQLLGDEAFQIFSEHNQPLSSLLLLNSRYLGPHYVISNRRVHSRLCKTISIHFSWICVINIINNRRLNRFRAIYSRLARVVPRTHKRCHQCNPYITSQAKNLNEQSKNLIRPTYPTPTPLVSYIFTIIFTIGQPLNLVFFRPNITPNVSHLINKLWNS